MYYLGIDLGGTNIAAGIVDEAGKLIRKDSVPTFRERHHSEIIKDMVKLSLKIIKDSALEIKDIKNIGIGCPGTPDNNQGLIIYANNIKFQNVPLRSEIQKYIDLPIYIENDANCAALAENVAGAAKDTGSSITITLGTGIGSGVVIDGKVYSGFNFSAAELGHTLLVLDGEVCTCGRKGCFEAYASATALINQTKKAASQNPESLINKLINNDLDKVDAKVCFDAAKQGDEVGKAVVNQYIKYLSAGLTNTINAFQPEVLVIGGGVCKEGEYLLEPLRKLVNEGVFCKYVTKTKIKVAQMGADAGIVGAAMLGQHK